MNDFDDDESERNQFCERSFWGIPETERFIQIYTDNYEEKQNIAFWMMLAKKMEEEGFEKRSDITLKQKFSNLRRSYKVCEARNKNRRNKIFKFNFYDLMEAALNPKTSGSRWTENQTNELIKAYSQIKQFSPDNLFEKVSKMLRYVCVKLQISFIVNNFMFIFEANCTFYEVQQNVLPDGHNLITT